MLMAERVIYNGLPDTIYFFGTRMRILMSGSQTGGSFCLIEVRSPAGNVVPPHRHRRETETIHVLEGGLTCATEGKRIAVTAGETVLLPVGVPHSLITGQADTRMMLLCTPAGFDDFVRAVGTNSPLAAAADARAHAVAEAARFGIEFVSA
jgi:quercetin dioxygenase-like cupin family protein